ncbi:RNA polymerase sigma-70 factor (ECF subfamily) [Pontibacter aydingkolensis]|uniref:RNA polymerase sigma factor n=1 Tax=Pontibacter aydingkolensis TaxID=1911536 RepID=A0ABS7CPB7_9BACT|nr:sigma-70 family RNA polymerase sigma factor [Pontibacter aydingkolensis]MBW7465692.1 sigma-70 family RNA polymerase sigma factor [Pontibacter aydingkolensis]
METISYQDVNSHVIDKCREGDNRAQYELYKLYSKAMFNVSMRITNDYSEAEDVLQEAFISAFKNLHTYKAEASFGSWLKKIVVNAAINAIRKRRSELVPMDERTIGDIAEETYEDDSEWKVEKVRKAIMKLPDGYRVVLSLYLLEGFDHAEIGEVLGITESTSKSQYSRAKKKLLDIMKEPQFAA